MDKNYYNEVIKPIEKKYYKMSTFYRLTKFNYFRNKMNLYNKILNYYYKSIIIK